MSAHGYDALRRELQPDERLIWGGCPRRSIHLPIGWAIVIALIVIVDLVVLTAATVGVIGKPDRDFIVFLVFATIVVCLIGISGAVEALRRRNTVYGLTDRRAIVISGIVRRRIRGVRLVAMSYVVPIERLDHIGTIRCVSIPDKWFRTNRRREIRPIPLFRAIVDPQHVHDLLLAEAKRAQRIPGSTDPDDSWPTGSSRPRALI